MEFQTNYYRPWHSQAEMNEGPVLVETAGYLSISQQVEMMMQEGKELAYARAAMFDLQPGQETVAQNLENLLEIDPTRRGIDMAAVSMEQRRLSAKFVRLEREEREKKAAELVDDEDVIKPAEEKVAKAVEVKKEKKEKEGLPKKEELEENA